MVVARLIGIVVLSWCVVPRVLAQSFDPTPLIQAHIDHMRQTHNTLIVDGTPLAEAVAQFYQRRNFAAAWSDRRRVDALLETLASTTADGLDPEDYRVARLQNLRAQWDRLTPQQHADFDVLATDGYLRALLHLLRGKVNADDLSVRTQFRIEALAPLDVIGAIDADNNVGSEKIAALFAQARPQHPLYKNLCAALANLRVLAAHGGWSELADGPLLKSGMSDARVAPLRQRLLIAGVLSEASDSDNDSQQDIYDEPLIAAVKRFQLEQQELADGIVGPATRAALNISVQQRIEQVRADLERARWLLRDLQNKFVLVNAASYRVWFYQDDVVIWSSRVVVGRPLRSTPVFKSKINRITLNPTWTVPPTIFRKDVLPEVRRDKNYLEKNHIRVFDSSGKIIAPAQVNWKNPGDITLRQDAGADNSLGRAAIRFPNPFSIYMHDTPHQELFGQNRRDFSSGCIRIERVLELVELLLDDATNWNRAMIDQQIATGITREVPVARPVQLLLTYWTSELQNDHVVFKPDIYDSNAPLLQVLNRRD